MKLYLLDTNILLRSSDSLSSQYTLARSAMAKVLAQGDRPVLTAQVLIEFWVVATRPLEVNGLGWTAPFTANVVRQWIAQFRLLEDTPEVFPQWLELVENYNIKGKRTHDIRLLAVMSVHQIPYLLTFNPSDFIPLAHITIVHPKDV